MGGVSTPSQRERDMPPWPNLPFYRLSFHRTILGSWMGIPFSCMHGTNHQVRPDFGSTRESVIVGASHFRGAGGAARPGRRRPLVLDNHAPLKAAWWDEYEAWRKRLKEKRYVYIWADGVYCRADGDRQCIGDYRCR